jgi:dTDP-4-dehydrorhamnose reductase
MRVLVTGAAGMLGTEMMSTDLHEAVGLSRAEFDIADPTASAELAAGTWGKFDAVINCAAYTAVDQAESERQLAYEVNALGPGYLGQAAVRLGARFFHVSTDFVFDGSATAPYQEEDRTNPLGVYGETKLLGEEAVRASGADWTIFRTAWLYGVHGKCFPRSILNAYLAKRSLKVVDDQIGSPTSASELAKVIWMALDRKIMPGIYHAAGPQAMSWHGVAERVVQAAGGDKSQIARIATSDWPTPAVRPKYSVLNSSKLEQAIGYQMKTDAIEQFVAEANA